MSNLEYYLTGISGFLLFILAMFVRAMIQEGVSFKELLQNLRGR